MTGFTHKNYSGKKKSSNKASEAVLFEGFCLSEWDSKEKFKTSFPSYREIADQLQIFPEAKVYLSSQSKLAQKILKKVQLIKYIIERKSQYKEFWFDVVDGLYKEPAEKIISRNNLAVSNNNTRLNLDRAKQFPITDLLQIRHNLTKCIFHKDENPSLHYYPHSNTVYCFSCNHYADSISVYQKLNNCSFIDAVKALS